MRPFGQHQTLPNTSLHLRWFTPFHWMASCRLKLKNHDAKAFGEKTQLLILPKLQLGVKGTI
jgi:hypothetical protein